MPDTPMVYYKKGLKKEAIEMCEKAKSLTDGQYPETLNALAWVFLEDDGNRDRAF